MTYDATKLPTVSSDSASVFSAQSTVSSAQDEPVSLELAKQHLRQPLPDDDDYIYSLIVVARRMAEERLNRTLVPKVLRAAFDSNDLSYALPKPPLVSIDAVTYVDAQGNSTILDASEYTSRNYIDPGYLVPSYQASWPRQLAGGGVVVVDYQAGYAVGEVPAPIVQWMLLAIGTMYETRETMSAGVQTFSIPEDFLRWLLQPYMVYE